MRVLLAATLLLLPSCVHLFTTRVDYTATASAPTVGDSAFRAEFIPKGAESGLALKKTRANFELIQAEDVMMAFQKILSNIRRNNVGMQIFKRNQVWIRNR